jgi:hypothetical protein
VRQAQLLVTAYVVPSSLIVSILMMVEAMRSFKTFDLTRATQCHISEDDILHSQHHENLISYINEDCIISMKSMPLLYIMSRASIY